MAEGSESYDIFREVGESHTHLTRVGELTSGAPSLRDVVSPGKNLAHKLAGDEDSHLDLSGQNEKE